MDSNKRIHEIIKKVVIEEREICLEIFFALKEKKKILSEIFGNNHNIYNIFFYDILKIFTQILLKNYEYSNKYNLKYFENINQPNLPYVSNKEIKEKVINLKGKNFGKKFESNFRIYLKNLYIFFLNLKNFSFFGKKIYLKGRGITKKNLNEFSKLKINASFVPYKRINIKNHQEQVLQIKYHIRDIISSNKTLSKIKNLDMIVIKHIESFLNKNFLFKTRKNKNCILICNSGIELDIRITRDEFKANRGKIINIIHGGSSGVLDEPLWGDDGDNYIADYVVGYGSSYSENFLDSPYLNIKNFEYFHRNPEFENLYNSDKKIQNTNLEGNNYYFPTTLRGGNYRHGPYQDIPDAIYLDWQSHLNKIFKGNVITKMHPKEKFSFLYDDKMTKKVYGKFVDIIKNADLFIFDYFSTIFVEACATDKPVIFFDLGIRNINLKSLELMKKRVVYFDVINDGIPNRETILTRVQNEKFNYDFVTKYSISKQIDKKSSGLVSIINKIL